MRAKIIRDEVDKRVNKIGKDKFGGGLLVACLAARLSGVL